MNPLCPTNPLNLLCVGDFQSDEMAGLPALAAAILPPLRSSRCLAELADLPGLLEDNAWMPDIVLVAVRHPDEHTERQVLDALALFPLTRWVVCLGVWCESALRTGLAWPAAVCVPARMAASRLRAEASALRGDVAPPPLTASREETLAADFLSCSGCEPASVIGDLAGTCAAVVGRGGGGLTRAAVVVSPDAAFEQTAAAFLRRAGYRIARDEKPELLVFDADPLDALLEPARRACMDRAPRRAVALMTLPTTDAVTRLRAAGFDAVVSKLDLSSIARDG